MIKILAYILGVAFLFSILLAVLAIINAWFFGNSFTVKKLLQDGKTKTSTKEKNNA